MTCVMCRAHTTYTCLVKKSGVKNCKRSNWIDRKDDEDDLAGLKMNSEKPIQR